MLDCQLTHPEIISALARSGHGSKVVIADGNFPAVTKSNPAAAKVFLNLSPGVVGAVDVLRAVCAVTPIESALVMEPPVEGEFAVQRPDIWDDFETVIKKRNDSIQLESVGRFSFYDCCQSRDVSLVIATGEQRIFANLLLTVGVIRFEGL